MYNFSVYIMKDISKFFSQKFKIDELRDIEDEVVKQEAGAGSENKAIFTCLGIGYLNLNKGIVWFVKLLLLFVIVAFLLNKEFMRIGEENLVGNGL